MHPFSFNTVEIDLAALGANYRNIRKMLGPRIRVMAVVKSDAYGHGLVECAGALARAGADCFGVAEVEEGVALRKSGTAGEIVILLGASAETYEEIVTHNLTPVVFDRLNIAGLSRQGAAMQADVGVHLKVDAGMGRLGVLPVEVKDYVDLINGLPSLHLKGILSHFPGADEPVMIKKTEDQLQQFKEIVGSFKIVDGEKLLTHIANSAGMLYFPDTHLDMVRPGISLYGCCPEGSSARLQECRPELQLAPVMRFTTRIVQIKKLPAGTGLSYGHTYVTRRPSRIGVLPVGYDDGYLRKLSNRAEVLIGGRRAPVCGRICMNATLVDLTDLPFAEAGDEVVLMGKQQEGEISADEVAGWMETISYEVLCLLGKCNRRVYRQDTT